LTQTLVTSGTMTNRIDRLAKKNLVERLPDPSDRRGVLVRLTDVGRDRADQALAGLLAQERAILAELSAAQRGELAGLLRQLTAPFDNIPGCPAARRPRRGTPLRRCCSPPGCGPAAPGRPGPRPRGGRGRRRPAWSGRPVCRGRSACG